MPVRSWDGVKRTKVGRLEALLIFFIYVRTSVWLRNELSVAIECFVYLFSSSGSFSSTARRGFSVWFLGAIRFNVIVCLRIDFPGKKPVDPWEIKSLGWKSPVGRPLWGVGLRRGDSRWRKSIWFLFCFSFSSKRSNNFCLLLLQRRRRRKSPSA